MESFGQLGGGGGKFEEQFSRSLGVSNSTFRAVNNTCTWSLNGEAMNANAKIYANAETDVITVDDA